MAHSLSRLAVPLALLVASEADPALASPNAVPIAETPACSVALTKVSYDSPGADNREFIELAVERFQVNEGAPPRPKPADPAPDGAPPPPVCHTGHGPDAGAGVDSGVTDARADAPAGALTLGDCGLEELRLVNGGGGACDEYRTIPLAAVIVPSDDFVVICAADSTLGGCDVTTAGRSALKNGFLQNGPNDGLRFVGVPDGVSLEARYEGGPSCFSPAAVNLVEETGEIAGTPGDDDINVACSGHFELQGATDAPLRRLNACSSLAPEAGAPVTQGTDAMAPAGNRASQPEFVPDGSAFPSYSSLPDAGAGAASRPSGTPLQPPGCSASAGRRSGQDVAWLLGAGAVALAVRRPTRRRTRLRAGSCVRSSSLPRRSP